MCHITLLIKLSYNNFVFSPTLKGLLKRKCGKADRFLVDGVTNKLFKNQEEHLVRTGAQKTATLSDLAARNIQRGRDHGIKYNSTNKIYILYFLFIFLGVTMSTENILECTT